MNPNYKSGFVAIIGRPNVGKSTLLNNILGYKVSIVTSKAQTTRDKIQGIYTTDTEQIVFIDTPGFHKAFNKLGEVLNDFAMDATISADLIIFLVDSTSRFDSLDEELIQNLIATHIPIGLVFNKKDLVKDLIVFNELVEKYKQVNTCFTLFINSTDSIEVKKILNEVINNLPNGPQYYPVDQLMDHDERFVAREVIREKIMLFTKQEVPHSVAISVESFKNDIENPNLLNIRAEIICERQSQKSILIGQNGQMIKKIGKQARLELENFFNKRIYLDLFIKVEDDWRNRPYYLKQFGYKLDK